MNIHRRAAAVLLVALVAGPITGLAQSPAWRAEWPKTDFSKTTVDLGEIMSGGPPKDAIPSIDDPKFVPIVEMTDLADTAPVIGLVIDGKARAYPLRVLTWHEIVNDTLAGVPVAVTYCPLCNAAIVFDRRAAGKVLEFGTTGKLRHSDLVMYDRQTESWWQQFSGEAIAGELAGTRLNVLPARLESWERFKERAPEGEVLVPNDPAMRAYGRNPYAGYDSADLPFLYRGPLPDGVPAMMRVVVVDGEAWTLPLLREKGTISQGDLTLQWEPGQNSALDSRLIAKGRDVGNVVARRDTGFGAEDAVYDVTFAFVFHAFHPDGVIHTQ